MNLTVKEFLNADVCINTTGASLQIKDRNACALIVTKSGAISFTQNGKTFLSVPGTPIFIPQGASYLNVCNERAESMMVNFLAETDITEITPLPYANISRLEPYFDILCSLSVKSLAIPLTFSEKCRVMTEIYSLFEILTENKSRTDTEQMFYLASDFIISSISDSSLDCSQVAEHVNISEVYLRRLFIKHAGIPTWKYIRKIRLERARKLLSDGVNVKNTAYMTGFSDVYSFSRAYSGYFGYPPSKT